MDHATAAFWLDVIAGIAAALWLLGAWFVIATRNALTTPRSGEVQVAGRAKDVLDHVAAALAHGRGVVLAGAAIDAADAREVRWHSETQPRHRGCITANDGGGRTTVRWQVDVPRAGLGGVAFITFGAAAVVALYSLLRTLVLPAEDPNLRGQVLQMVQAVHVLWPPFLIAGMARMMHRRVTADVERMIRNAPFAARANATR